MQLPKGWTLKSLGELGECIIGLTYRPDNIVSEGGSLVLRSSNVQDGRLSFHDNVFVDNIIPERLQVQAGDILVCVRNGSRSLIGKSAVIEEEHLNRKLTFGAFMSVYRTKHSNYIRHLFDSDMYYNQVKNNLGATINQITNKNLNSFEFPFPNNKKERDAIAEVLSTIDKKIALIGKKIVEVKKLKTGLIQKLYRQGFGTIDNNGNWHPHSTFSKTEIGLIPATWTLVKLEDIVQVNPKPHKLSNNNTLVSFIGMADTSEESKLISQSTRPYIDVKKGFTSFIENDVLVAKITPCFENGKGALAKNLVNGVGFGSTEFHVLRCKKGLSSPSFIHYLTTSESFRIKGEMSMTGTAGQKRISKAFIEKYLVGCPPLNEQEKIAEVLNAVDNKKNLLEQQKSETQLLKKGLMQKLLTGEWRVPLDCNEEEAA